MIGEHRVLAIIPARGGSRGVPRKNIRPLAGKPLLHWTIEAAHASRFLDRTILSSEDTEIMEVARAAGCEVPFRRPAELARDDTPGVDPVLHALDAIGEEYDYVVVLQPTSPLRTAEDIDAALRACADAGSPCCVSVSPASKHPLWCYGISDTGRLTPILDQPAPARRQELPPAYFLNGAIYIGRPEVVRAERGFLSGQTLAHVMPPERSLDIDSELDFRLCEVLLRASGLSATGS